MYSITILRTALYGEIMLGVDKVYYKYFLVFIIKRHCLYIIKILCSRPNAQIKIKNLLQILPTFTVQICTHHVYLRVGDIERAWLTRSVVPNTLIHFDFYTFLADTRTTIHIEAILLASVLYYYI